MAEPTSTDLAAAVKILRGGGLVAFPTETVYGLGADATNADAVRRIFAAKGRPANNPLIVHVADETVARRYAAQWPDEASILAKAFWPGPLTLVLPKSPRIVGEATAGLGTVGLRVPKHPMALELLAAFDGALAAPSANRSGRISPTMAAHVLEELGDRVDMILDGGPCAVGIESTVIDLTSRPPMILRPGGTSREKIEQLIGPIDVFAGSVEGTSAGPGLQAVHYSPRTPTLRFAYDGMDRFLQWLRVHPQQVVVMTLTRPTTDLRAVWLPMPENPETYARLLYAKLREADQLSSDAICIQMPPDEPDWSPVRDRLIRASSEL